MEVCDPDLAPDLPAAGPLGPPAPPLGSGVDVARPVVRPRGGTQNAQRIFLIIAAAGGLWSGLFDASVGELLPTDTVVGIVLVSGWAFASPRADTDLPYHRHLRQAAIRRCCSGHVLGLVEYPVLDVAELVRPAPCVSGATASSVLQTIANCELKVASQPSGAVAETVRSVIARWLAAGARHAILAKLAPAFGRLVRSSQIPVLHTVAFGSRLGRKRLLAHREPSAVAAHAWLAAHPQQDAGGSSSGSWAGILRKRTVKATSDARLTIEWLEASAFVKDSKKSFLAARAFARLFARGGRHKYLDLVDGLKLVHREVLRQGRVRIDVLGMLLHRAFFEQSISGAAGQRVGVYIYTDASPQWRASDLLATTMDVFDAGTVSFHRRLLPVVALDGGRADAIGKALELLWQLFLVCGPTWRAMTEALRRVRAFITDLGTERKICDLHGGVLLQFFELLGCPPRPCDLEAHPVGQWLFPVAVQIPGWRHQVDLLLQRGLSRMEFFFRGGSRSSRRPPLVGRS